MRIRDVLKPKELYLPSGGRSVAANRTRTMAAPVQAPSRIARRRERLASQDIFVTADPNDEMTGDLPPALNPSPTSLAPLSTPHTRDLDFIKAKWPDFRGKPNSNPSVLPRSDEIVSPYFRFIPSFYGHWGRSGRCTAGDQHSISGRS
jgi:hypothetical protein